MGVSIANQAITVGAGILILAVITLIAKVILLPIIRAIFKAFPILQTLTNFIISLLGIYILYYLFSHLNK